MFYMFWSARLGEYCHWGYRQFHLLKIETLKVLYFKINYWNAKRFTEMFTGCPAQIAKGILIRKRSTGMRLLDCSR